MMKTITITMDDLGKPITFGLGLVVGIAASSITLYALSGRDTDDEIKSITSNRSNKENKATQTVPISPPSPEPKLDFVDGLQFIDDDQETLRSPSPTNTIFSSVTSPYYDAEDNLSFYRLYTEALGNLPTISAPRRIRTKQMNCSCDQEFVAKAHCLRLAFAAILDDDDKRQYFTIIGRDIIEMLSVDRSYDVKECFKAYDHLISYVSNFENHGRLKKELEGRGIPCISFYDIVLDYIVLDSFDDLEDPPSTIISVAQNTWFSTGFKETALRAAVMALLKMKRSKMMYEEGFFANFYNILDHILPVLIWGFLGNDSDLNVKCNLVKSSLLTAIKDYFNFDRARYTSLKDLSHDIVKITEEHYNSLKSKLAEISS
ncbi:mitoguardin isoform X1 [Brevipalpus obovatus]|uniref:mitoguardin isoform X1 n=1 Tax=Brevipalpus obovatus TaxID=246614 RepID=UPI003D9E18F6